MAVPPAVGFEPTTNRLTADRSTTELRWIDDLRGARIPTVADRDWLASSFLPLLKFPGATLPPTNTGSPPLIEDGGFE